MATLAPLAVALVHNQASVREASLQAAQRSGASAQVAAGRLGAALQAARGLVAVVENLPSFWDDTDDERDHFLAALPRSFPTLEAVEFYTPDLQPAGSSRGAPGQSRALVQELVALPAEPGGARFAARVSGGQGEAAWLPMLVAVHEPGGQGRSGYLLLALRLDRLTELWAPMVLPAQNRLALVDPRTMTILASRSGEGVEPELEVEPDQLQQLASGVRVAPVTEPDGGKWLRAVSAVSDTPWVVLVDVGEEAVVEPIYQGALKRLALSLAIAFVTISLLVLLWLRLRGRVRRLQTAAASWSQGDFAHRVGLSGNDELEQVGQAFDSMAAELEVANLERIQRQAEREWALARRETLLRVARRLGSGGDGEHLLGLLLEEAVTLVGGNDGTVARWDSGREALIRVRSFSGRLESGPEVQLDISASGRAARHRTVVVVNDYQQKLGQTTPAGRLGAEAAVAVPLQHDGRLLGTLSVTSDQLGRRFGRDEAELLELLSGMASAMLVGLERARLEAVLLAARTAQHELNNRLALSRGYAELLSISPELPESLQEMTEEIVRGTAEAATVLATFQRVTRLKETSWGPDVGSTLDLIGSTRC
jgi:HAMP domain-containing protein